MNEFGVRLFCPTPRGWIEFVGEDAHGDRDRDAFGGEEPICPLVLPIETGARERGVRQPGHRDVVEDVVAREAFGFAGKDTCDQLVAARVVIKEVSRETDG